MDQLTESIQLLKKQTTEAIQNKSVDCVEFKNNLEQAKGETVESFPTVNIGTFGAIKEKMKLVLSRQSTNWFEKWKIGDSQPWDKAGEKLLNDHDISQSFSGLELNQKRGLLYRTFLIVAGEKILEEQIDKNIVNPAMQSNHNLLVTTIRQAESAGKLPENFDQTMDNAGQELFEMFALDEPEAATSFYILGDLLPEDWDTKPHDQSMWKDTTAKFCQTVREIEYLSLAGKNELAKRFSWMALGTLVKEKVRQSKQ